MSDRLTQKELRDWSIMAWDDTHIKCQMCGEHSTGLPSKPEQHRPGCPCDPANVVVSRDVLGALWAMAAGLDHDCDLQRIHAEVTAALGEETAP